MDCFFVATARGKKAKASDPITANESEDTAGEQDSRQEPIPEKGHGQGEKKAKGKHLKFTFIGAFLLIFSMTFHLATVRRKKAKADNTRNAEPVEEAGGSHKDENANKLNGNTNINHIYLSKSIDLFSFSFFVSFIFHRTTKRCELMAKKDGWRNGYLCSQAFGRYEWSYISYRIEEVSVHRMW